MSKSNKMIRSQNITYYDKIAASYDAILNDHAKNDFIRSKVAKKLSALLQTGTVLDFGGGTGQDLNWLVKNDYNIIFCEPSPAMRKIAIEKKQLQFQNAEILFLENDTTDFSIWHQSLPFEEKVDAVLANFAVLNCILNVELLFANLALVTAPNANIVLLLLDYSYKQKIHLNFFDAVSSFLSKKTMEIKIPFDNSEQLVYLHSLKSIKNAAADYFEFKSAERLHEYGFSLIHLIKK